MDSKEDLSHISQENNLYPPDKGRRRRQVSDPYNSSYSSYSLLSTDSGYGTHRPSTPEIEPVKIQEQLRSEMKPAERNHATFQCTLCPRGFSRAFSLQRHLRIHNKYRPFVCTICGQSFHGEKVKARHEARHEANLHSQEKTFVCRGTASDGSGWGCGLTFHNCESLACHFHSKKGCLCIKPLWEEENLVNRIEQIEAYNNHQVSDNTPRPLKTPAAESFRASTIWPVALLQQYPALATSSFMATEIKRDETNEIEKSIFHASDTKYYDDEVRLMDWSASTLYEYMISTSPHEESPHPPSTAKGSTKSPAFGHSLPTTSCSLDDQNPRSSLSDSDSGEPVADGSSPLRACTALMGEKTLNVAKQEGDAPTGMARSDLSEMYELILMKNQETQALLISGEWPKIPEIEHSHPDLDSGEHTPSNLHAGQLESSQHLRGDIPSENHQQLHTLLDGQTSDTTHSLGAVSDQLLPSGLFSSYEAQPSHPDTLQEMNFPFLKKDHQQERSTCSPYRVSIKPSVCEDPNEVASKEGYRHGTQQALLEDADSMVYDTATPGSAYSVTASSSATDELNSDSETVYGNSSWAGTPDSDQQDNLVLPILDPARRELIERVMTEFHSMMDQNRGLRSRGNSTGSHQSGVSSAGDLRESVSVTGGGKRKLEGDDDEENLNQGRGDGSNKIPRTTSDNGDIGNCRFACPYFKRNSRKHRRYRSCAGPGWDTVHRVKEHLYRRHALPIQCSRCCRPFKSETELKQHHRTLQSCEIRDEDPPEGFGKEQEKLLKSRKKAHPNQGEEGKWKEVYRILFPDEDESLMPSPYYDNEETLSDARWKRHRSNEFAHYEEFLSRELPRRVRRELEVAVSQASEALEDQLKSQLVEIVRSCQAQLFRSYQQSHHTVEASGKGDETHMPPQESHIAATLPRLVEDDLAAFFAPPFLPENELLPSLDATPSIPRCYPPRSRSGDLDSGYGSHNLSSFQNQGSSPVGKSNEGNEQAGVTSHIAQNFSESDNQEISESGFTFEQFRPDNFEVGFWSEDFGNDFPALNASNQAEGLGTFVNDDEILSTMFGRPS